MSGESLTEKEKKMRIFTWLLVIVLGFCLLPVVAHAAQATLTYTDPNDNELGNHVERKDSLCPQSVLSFNPLVDVTDQLPLATKTYVDRTVKEGGSYCYRLNAYNPAGVSPWSNTADITIPFTVPKTAPSLTGVVAAP
jgi:hypothetical protein